MEDFSSLWKSLILEFTFHFSNYLHLFKQPNLIIQPISVSCFTYFFVMNLSQASLLTSLITILHPPKTSTNGEYFAELVLYCHAWKSGKTSLSNNIFIYLYFVGTISLFWDYGMHNPWKSGSRMFKRVACLLLATLTNSCLFIHRHD